MNNDLISRSELKKDFEERNKACDKWIEEAKDEETKIRADATKLFICEVIMTIDNAPTVERPQGKWEQFSSHTVHCSCCNKNSPDMSTYIKMNYCPNCGADMRGDSHGQ